MQEVKNDKKQEKNLVSKDVINEDGNNEMPITGQDNSENEGSLSADGQEKPKIYLVELMFIFPILIVADIIDVFSLTGIGAVLSWAMDLVATGVTTLWLFWKGRRVEWNLAGNAVEFIPVVDVLPIRTTTFIILMILDSKRGKRIMNKVSEVNKKISSVKK
jgi:hypothetical protein